MRWSVGLLSLVVALSACSGGAEPVVTAAVDAPVSTVADDCAGDDLQVRSVLLRSAEDGEIPVDVPVRLGVALNEVPATLLGGLLYAGCSAEQVDDLAFELMAWTNGIGVLFVAWQEWPGDGEPGNLPLGGEARQAGVVQVSSVDELVDDRVRTRIIHLFDGVRVVTVATFSLTTLSIERVEEIAWAIYDAIPVDLSNRAGVGVTRSLQELLVALASDQISISDPEGISEMSPFMATTGTAHATYRFTAADRAVTVFDFGGVGAADRAAAVVSTDGYTIGHAPYEMLGTPRFWQWDRLIVQFMGDEVPVIERLNEVIGPAFAGGEED